MSRVHKAMKNIKLLIKEIFKKIGIKETSVFYNYLKYAIYPTILGVFLELRVFDKSVLYIDSFIHVLDKAGEISIDHSVLFSTSAAIISTVFTIIFVLLTLFIQMSGEYTSADILKSTETKNLMRLYASTAIFSLMMLETTCQFPIVVFTLTSICIASVYPFLQSMNSKIVYDIGIQNFRRKIPQIIASNDEYAYSEIKSLNKLSRSAIKDNKLRELLHITTYFTQIIAYIIREDNQKKMPNAIAEIGFQYLDLLEYLTNKDVTIEKRAQMIGLLLSQNKEYILNCSDIIEHNDLKYQIWTLKGIGIKMIKSDSNDGNLDSNINEIVYTIGICFDNIYKKRMENNGNENDEAINSRENDFVDKILEFLEELTRESYKAKLKVSPCESVQTLWEIGAKLFQLKTNTNFSSRNLRNVVNQLNDVELLLKPKTFEGLFDYYLQSVNGQDTEKYLAEFKEYYDREKNTPLFAISLEDATM